MKRYYVTTQSGQSFTVLARDIDDAAWTGAAQLNNGDVVIRVEPF